MGFKVDFSELDNLQDKLKITQQNYEYFLRNFLIEMANRVIAKTKPRTPKDTGSLRGAWQLGRITNNGKMLEIEINNSTEYATEIEYGHRIVRNNVEVGYYNGRFMLKVSIDEVNRQMPARYKKAFESFCRGKGLDVN